MSSHPLVRSQICNSAALSLKICKSSGISDSCMRTSGMSGRLCIYLFCAQCGYGYFTVFDKFSNRLPEFQKSVQYNKSITIKRNPYHTRSLSSLSRTLLLMHKLVHRRRGLHTGRPHSSHSYR